MRKWENENENEVIMKTKIKKVVLSHNTTKLFLPVVGFDPTSSPLWADNQPSVRPLLVDGGEGWGFRRSSAELHRLVFATFYVQLDDQVL